MVVLTYALMHQVVVYLSILQEKHNSLEVKITTFFDDLLTVITPLNLLITEKEEEFHDSDVS